jgi:hypothetical protein
MLKAFAISMWTALDFFVLIKGFFIDGSLETSRNLVAVLDWDSGGRQPGAFTLCLRARAKYGKYFV